MKDRDCIIFLHGKYARRHLPFYRRLCRGRYKIAADGGISFFKLSRMIPDLVIGDFDSARGVRLTLGRKTKIVKFPADKNATDAQLALEHCLNLKSKPATIIIVQPSVGEPDHFAANLLLPAQALKGERNAKRIQIRLINHAGEWLLLKNERQALYDAVGDLVSVIPVSESISLTAAGMKFPASKLKLKLGETMSLRNRIVSTRASVTVRGIALLYHKFR